MLTVRTGNTSPFGRKIRIAVKVLGLEREVAIAPASTLDPADPLRQQNPLGKVPVLILDDGAALYDSPVILEYLDYRAGGGKIIPKDPQPRFAALRLQALADGIMDASILINYEARYRPAQNHEPKWLDLQAGKVARGAGRARSRAARHRRAARCRPDHARLRARLSRLSLPGKLARRASAPHRLARYLRGARARLRRHHAPAGLN